MNAPVCLCGHTRFDTVFEYVEPPRGEVRFGFSNSGAYRRQMIRCPHCGHFLSVHEMDSGQLYEGAYVDATYGDTGIRDAFERITALEPSQSDNVGRVERVVAFAREHFGVPRADAVLSILDVGSGLCVFLHRIRSVTHWSCTALDPDARAVRHAREHVGVSGICGDFMERTPDTRFDIMTFNKVLEHVADPVAMLAHALDFIEPEGFVYVEVPDGEAAVHEGPEREEFFIDHPHVFSAASVRLLGELAGFQSQIVERLREPSSKFTLRAFMTVRAAAVPGVSA